jgi:hypothetical protein
VIVRWGLAELPGVLDELSISRPLLISTERWRHVQLPVHDRFHGVRAHAEIAGVIAARESVSGADGLIASPLARPAASPPAKRRERPV